MTTPFSKQIIDKQLLASAEKLIDKAQNIVITGHTRPDGDALGATLGLAMLLNKLGKNAMVVVPDTPARYYNFIPNYDRYIIDFDNNNEQAKELIANAELLFCVDFQELYRTGKEMSNYIASVRDKFKVIMIDHHEDPDLELADVMISYPKLSSSCELMFRFICRLGYAQMIDKEIATSILTGILTDTGILRYNSNDADLYGIIQFLLNVDSTIQKDQIVNAVHSNYNDNRMALIGYCFNNAIIFDSKKWNCKVAILPLPYEKCVELNYKNGDTEGIVNMPMETGGLNISILLREDKIVPHDGEEYIQIKISLRSQGDIPVNEIAAHFGGGGHINASGAEVNASEMSLDQVIEKLKTIIE